MESLRGWWDVQGAEYEKEDLAKASARTDLNPFVVESPDGGGCAWSPAGTN